MRTGRVKRLQTWRVSSFFVREICIDIDSRAQLSSHFDTGVELGSIARALHRQNRAYHWHNTNKILSHPPFVKTHLCFSPPQKSRSETPNPTPHAMPTLAAVDVSVTDDRISLVFSHRAIAQAYAKHLESEDRRSSFASSSHQQQQSPPTIPNYRRSPRFNPAAKEVSVALPSFITWFITCRLPDDEDSITFTFDDADEQFASRWAESMLLFERVTAPVYDENLKQLHVRRLWNASQLQKRLEDLRRPSSSSSGSPRRGPTPGPQGPRQGQQQHGGGGAGRTQVTAQNGGRAGWWS